MSKEDSQKVLNELIDTVADRTKLTPEQSEKVLLAILRNGWSLTHTASQQVFAINPEAPDEDDLTVIEDAKEEADESVDTTSNESGSGDKGSQGE